jgi:uncharacterized membrane protein YfcA
MTLEPIAVAILVVLVTIAAVVNGTIGFGFALLAVNALALVLDARNGVIAMSTITPIVSGLQVLHHRRHLAVLARLRTVLLMALVGNVAGTFLLINLPAFAISLALGAFTIWFAVDSMRRERPPMSGTTERWMGPVAGVLGGISNGALGASGPVFGTYLAAIGLRAGAFAFGISSAFFVMSVLRIGLLAALGQYTPFLLALGLGLAIPAVLGQRLGFWFRGRLSTAALYKAVLAVLFLAGANLIVRALVDALA